MSTYILNNMPIDIPVLPVDENINKATNNLAESLSDEINLIRVDPPSNSDGMDVGNEFLESVHFLETQKRFLRGNKNLSPTCGMEVWYESNKIKFMFYTPTKDIETEYRQQLSGYYPECEVAQQTPNEGMFIRTKSDEHEAVAVTRFQLNKHYFMPLANPESEDSQIETDPFKRIFNEIDTKDDTRLMIQYLYKPAPYNWTEGQQNTLETYADRLQNKGSFKTRYGGLKVEEVEDPGIFDSAASEMRARLRKPAFFVNIRLAIICRGETQDKAERKAQMRGKAVVNAFTHLYQTRAGQELKPKTFRINKERNARQILINMIERNTEYMSKPKRIYDWAWHKLTPNHDIIVMTADELAGHVHLPSPDDVTTGAISFKDEMVTGEVPPDVDEFEPVPKEERTGFSEEDIPDLSNKDDDDEEKNNKDKQDTPSAFDDVNNKGD